MDQDDDLFKRLREEIKQETASMVTGEPIEVPQSVVNRYVNRIDESSSSKCSNSSTASDSSDDEEEFSPESKVEDNPVEMLRNEILQTIEIIEPKLDDLKKRCDERMTGRTAPNLQTSDVTDLDIETIQEKVQRMTTKENEVNDIVAMNNNDQPNEFLKSNVYTVDHNTAMPPLSGPLKNADKSQRVRPPTVKQQQEFLNIKRQMKTGLMKAQQKLIRLKDGDPQPGNSLVITRMGSTSTVSQSDAGSTRRRRRGSRRGRGGGGKTPSEDGDECRPKQAMEISKENLIILTLLALDAQQKEDYLIKIARERGLLINYNKNEKKQMIIKRKYYHIQQELKSKCLQHTYGHSAAGKESDRKRRDSTPTVVDHPHIRPFINAPNSMKTIQPKKTKSFESEVTRMLHGSKELKPEDIKLELQLENVSKAEKNAFTMPENVTELETFVEKLVKDGIGYVIEGEIRINAKNNYQAFVPDSTRNVDCYINSIMLRKCAMDGDLVQVFVKYEKESEQQLMDTTVVDQDTTSSSLDETKSSESEFDTIKELEPKRNNHGFVIKILKKKHDRKCVGSFGPYMKDAKYIKFIPRDMKMPSLRIFRQNWPDAVIKSEFNDIEKVLYLAEIIDWQDDEPIGNIIQSIGQSGELQVENTALLMEHDLDVKPFSEEILSKLPSSPYQIPQKEIDTREDLRSECVFTIDPLTARDLDDAMSCKLLKNGNYEIGVHISDVTYFLEEGSELDELVKLKATTIYMVDNVYHMLPKPLCFLCSLLPGEDKLAFSVFWEMTPDATIVKTRFARTIINSCTQFAYEHAQIMLENPKKNFTEDEFPPILHGYSPNYISRIINHLQAIAVELRKKRMENGCLKINQPKLSFMLDPESGRPKSYAVYELKESNQLIEDFMLLANISVAKFTFEKFPDISILRNHFPPQSRTMEALKKNLEKHGYNLEIDSSKNIYESIRKIVENSENAAATEAVINILTAKPMTRARYFCSATAHNKDEFEHFALAVSIYTHFTSPIRRYADVMVHRVLAAAMEYAPKPSRTSEELTSLASICNVQKYNAKLAGDGSSNLYFMHYVKDQKRIQTRASVLGIFQNQLEVVLIETGHVVKVTFKTVTKSSKFKITNPEDKPIKSCVIIPENKQVAARELRLFSLIDVIVEYKNNLLIVTSVLPPANANTRKN